MSVDDSGLGHHRQVDCHRTSRILDFLCRLYDRLDLDFCFELYRHPEPDCRTAAGLVEVAADTAAQMLAELEPTDPSECCLSEGPAASSTLALASEGRSRCWLVECGEEDLEDQTAVEVPSVEVAEVPVHIAVQQKAAAVVEREKNLAHCTVQQVVGSLQGMVTAVRSCLAGREEMRCWEAAVEAQAVVVPAVGVEVVPAELERPAAAVEQA